MDTTSASQVIASEVKVTAPQEENGRQWWLKAKDDCNDKEGGHAVICRQYMNECEKRLRRQL